MRTRSIDSSGALIGPALLVLLLVFLVPLIWFFVKTLVVDTGAGENGFMATAGSVLSSRSVQVALSYTIWNSLLVTVIALVLGYPMAYYLANRSGVRFTLVLFCIVIPYFTSTIVRTYAWMVLLGDHGAINSTLQWLRVVSAPLRLLYTNGAVVVGMVYVMLPFVILTLYSVMKRIDPSLVRAALALGASPFYAFRRVYLPLTFNGVVSAGLMVLILSIGFFITPALMGGPRDVMLGTLIQRSVELTVDWQSASIMSLILLVATLLLYAVYARVTDIRRLIGAGS
jgi:ABC-type spermidine/putrescine transport system permease subunit I